LPVRKIAFLSRAIEFTSILALSICSLHHVAAHARYDDHEMRDRIFVSLGGLSTQNMHSQLRIDPKGVGIGTIVDLEDDFDLPKSVSVLRLDGYFRLSKAHRIEWTYFDLKRDGSATLVDRDVQIGDVVFPIQYRVASEWKFSVIKASYTYSFINTAKYEFYLGGGLNIRNISFGFTGVGSVLGTTDTRVFDDNGKLPLPTLTVGMQYNVSDKLSIRFRTESFFIGINDTSGRWQDTYALVDYRIGDRVGIGGGVNVFNIDVEGGLRDNYRAQTESSYTAFLLYVSARFPAR
jgi:hypothetical protein